MRYADVILPVPLHATFTYAIPEGMMVEEGVRVLVPRTLVITTTFFDRFILENGLQYVINADLSDEEILNSKRMLNKFLEESTGFTAKQRMDRAKKKAKEGKL